MAVVNLPNACRPPCHGGHNHGPTRQQINVAGELARSMADDHSIAIGRNADFDFSRFNDTQIHVGLTGAKDGFTISVIVHLRHGFEMRDFRVTPATSLEKFVAVSRKLWLTAEWLKEHLWWSGIALAPFLWMVAVSPLLILMTFTVALLSVITV